MSYIYYHNPKCSKSRAGLEYLKEKNVIFKIKEYLKEELSKEELRSIFKKLELAPEFAIRNKESALLDLNLNIQDVDENKWCEIIISDPIILERPILVGPTRAKIGRPTENLLLVLDS